MSGGGLPEVRHADLRWYPNGQAALGGSLLRLSRALDGMFLAWAAEDRAAEHRFPTFIPASALAKLDYFHSFPQLVTFPVTLDADEENIKRFSDGTPMDGHGVVTLGGLSPVRDVLTPAACYHFYLNFQGEQLPAARVVTTLATCFRREREYLPLQRQWSFSMREIVCLGTAEEVKSFLDRSQRRVAAWFESVKLPIAWQQATDPFFNPSRNPKYLMQKLDPVKTEMVFKDELAIGSVNFHRNYFGEAFGIRRDGQEAFTGCIAFGLERWLYAWLAVFGPDERNWPKLPHG